MDHVFNEAPEPPTELGRYRILSNTAGVRVSPLCLGALSIGDAWKGVSEARMIQEPPLRSSRGEDLLTDLERIVTREHEQGIFVEVA